MRSAFRGTRGCPPVPKTASLRGKCVRSSRLQRKHSTRRRRDGRFLRAAPSGPHVHDRIDVARNSMYVPQLSSKSSRVAPSAHTTGRKRGTDSSARVDSCFESGDSCTFHLKCTQNWRNVEGTHKHAAVEHSPGIRPSRGSREHRSSRQYVKTATCPLSHFSLIGFAVHATET